MFRKISLKYSLIILVGIIMGFISTLFLKTLIYVSNQRDTHPTLVWCLPLISLVTVFCYHRFGSNSNKGNNLIIESLHDEHIIVPTRMGFLVFLFTLFSHLTGGSVGREGTAVQIGGVVSTTTARLAKLSHEDRKIIVFSGVSAGFGSVFGTPFAGVLFAIEFCEIGAIHYEAALPCFIASFTANAITGLFQISHERYAIHDSQLFSGKLFGAVIIASILFGLTARLFIIAVDWLKHLYVKYIYNNLFRAFLGGCVVLAFIHIFELKKFEGLSTWMIDAGFHGEISWLDPVKKFILTVLSLGAGLQGGEATPLFDIGASIGGLTANVFGLEPSLFAALGYLCVFGNAANVPVTTIIMGLELYGPKSIVYFIIAAVIGHYTTGFHSIYNSQRIRTAKYPWGKNYAGKKIGDI